MYIVIRKFLALYHHLSLPGIGNFNVETQPAKIDFASHTISCSKNTIVFSNDKVPAEKKFYEFLSRELHVDEVQAIKSFTNFTSHLQDDLNEKNNLYFKGIGTLTKQTSHVLTFQPDEMPVFFPDLTAERVIRKNAMHTVKVGEDERTSEEMHTALHQPKKIKKERWWIAAIILAVIGIAAIVFYYASHH
jgi:nucleoid DNA-binding protein